MMSSLYQSFRYRLYIPLTTSGQSQHRIDHLQGCLFLTVGSMTRWDNSFQQFIQKKMSKFGVFYVARNCVHRKHVDQTNLLKLFRSVCCVLKTVYEVYFMIQSSQLLLPLPFKPGNPSFLREYCCKQNMDKPMIFPTIP